MEKLRYDAAAAEPVIRSAVEEDVGTGDVSAAILPENKSGKARIISREAGTAAGLPAAAQVYALLDPAVSFKPLASDGQRLAEGDAIARLKGPIRSLLTGERTALNLLGLLCGIATRTAEYVDAVAGTSAEILDTRKTHPGLRYLSKYAVRAGGGHNHRMGLYDMVLIKDNHLTAESITDAVAKARELYPALPVEIEVDTLDQFKEALATGAHYILLDNMPPGKVKQAVTLAAGRPDRPQLEASGGICLENVRYYAETGVDRISVGSLTHSMPALDLSMEMES